MSTYYEFYAAVEKGGNIEAIGPYVRKDGEYRLTPILSRSRSFIQWDEFGYWDLPIEKMAEDQIEFFTDTGWISDERQQRNTEHDRPEFQIEIQVFFHALMRERRFMKDTKPNEETIICRCTDDPGIYVALSEEAASRIAWVLTGVIGILTLPFIILAVMI